MSSAEDVLPESVGLPLDLPWSDFWRGAALQDRSCDHKLRCQHSLARNSVTGIWLTCQ